MSKAIYEVHEYRGKGKFVVRHGTFDDVEVMEKYIQDYIAPRRHKIVVLALVK